MSQELLNIENLMRGMPSAPTAQFKLIKPRKEQTEKKGKTPSVSDVREAVGSGNISPEEAFNLNPNSLKVKNSKINTCPD